MGKKNSKLKQDTIDRLTTDTYCEYSNCHHHFGEFYGRNIFGFDIVIYIQTTVARGLASYFLAPDIIILHALVNWNR